ncbi:MAG: hypothetical protein ACHQU0_00020 [Candidatus Paceibacteria bacterium]
MDYTDNVDYQYPLLKKISEYYRTIPHDVGDVYLACCQHMLEPQLHMFEELIDFGFNPAKIFVLGKIYSTNTEVFSKLSSLGIHAVQPDFLEGSFDEEHKNNCRRLIEMIPDSAECIVLDDGAELIKNFVDINKRVLFAVEQTSSGFRKLENQEIPFPILNVARSATKLMQESPLIARHAYERMKEYFSDKGIISPHILVVGLGPIGEAVKEIFEEDGFSIAGFDIKYGHTDLLAFISATKPDVVIGATGVSILTEGEIEQLPSDKPMYLISISSSDREFPVAFFRKGDNPTHSDTQYKNFIFVNNGFPVSFMGNRYELTPIEIEKTLCLLVGAVMYGTTMKGFENGLCDLPRELEGLINE